MRPIKRREQGRKNNHKKKVNTAFVGSPKRSISSSNIDAFIPDSYIGNEFQKLDIYKRIAGIESQQEYDDMLEELLDLRHISLMGKS